MYNEQISDLLNPPPKEEDFVVLTPKQRMLVRKEYKYAMNSLIKRELFYSNMTLRI